MVGQGARVTKAAMDREDMLLTGLMAATEGMDDMVAMVARTEDITHMRRLRSPLRHPVLSSQATDTDTTNRPSVFLRRSAERLDPKVPAMRLTPDRLLATTKNPCSSFVVRYLLCTSA